MNIEVVKDYYGKVLKSSGDLKTSACCDGSDLPAHLKPLLANLHEEVRSKYYGCCLVVPAALEGARVLDLGSGSGRLSHRPACWRQRRGGRRRYDRRAARHGAVAY